MRTGENQQVQQCVGVRCTVSLSETSEHGVDNYLSADLTSVRGINASLLVGMWASFLPAVEQENWKVFQGIKSPSYAGPLWRKLREESEPALTKSCTRRKRTF